MEAGDLAQGRRLSKYMSTSLALPAVENVPAVNSESTQVAEDESVLDASLFDSIREEKFITHPCTLR